MFKRITILLLLLLFNISVFAQTGHYSAPVKWVRYKVFEKNVSVLFPKLPVVSQYTDVCKETEQSTYYTYAGEVVYFLRIYSKAKSKPPKSCTVKGKFDEKSLSVRIAELKNSAQNIKSSETIQSNKKVLKLEKDSSTDLVFDDLENDRWFELSVVHRKDAGVNVKDFFESINFDKNLTGIEIGDGAKSVLGDEQIIQKGNSVTEESGISETQVDNYYPLTVVLKIRPDYTDAARSNNYQGTVELRVTFLGNGGIGEISIKSGAKFGLTEKAIEAARKIAFLPVKKNDKNVDVTKIVQYKFSIY